MSSKTCKTISEMVGFDVESLRSPLKEIVIFSVKRGGWIKAVDCKRNSQIFKKISTYAIRKEFLALSENGYGITKFDGQLLQYSAFNDQRSPKEEIDRAESSSSANEFLKGIGMNGDRCAEWLETSRQNLKKEVENEDVGYQEVIALALWVLEGNEREALRSAKSEDLIPVVSALNVYLSSDYDEVVAEKEAAEQERDRLRQQLEEAQRQLAQRESLRHQDDILRVSIPKRA